MNLQEFTEWCKKHLVARFPIKWEEYICEEDGIFHYKGYVYDVKIVGTGQYFPDDVVMGDWSKINFHHTRGKSIEITNQPHLIMGSLVLESPALTSCIISGVCMESLRITSKPIEVCHLKDAKIQRTHFSGSGAHMTKFENWSEPDLFMDPKYIKQPTWCSCTIPYKLVGEYVVRGIQPKNKNCRWYVI